MNTYESEGIRVVAGPGPLGDVLEEALPKLAAMKAAAREQGIELSPPPRDVPFLLWSNKHQAWWRPDAMGYTTDTARAGRYAAADATRHVVESAMCGRLDQVTCMVAAPENWGQPA